MFSQILNYATFNTKGNRSEAIVELIELGLAVFSSQQATQSSNTVQDNVSFSEMRETVAALASQVDQLSHLMQDTVLQRLAAVETELTGESIA